MAYLILIAHETTNLYLDADSKEDACRKLGVEIESDPETGKDLYYLKVGAGHVLIEFKEIEKVSSRNRDRVVAEVQKVMYDLNMRAERR